MDDRYNLGKAQMITVLTMQPILQPETQTLSGFEKFEVSTYDYIDVV